jgi:hypothetical protein
VGIEMRVHNLRYPVLIDPTFVPELRAISEREEGLEVRCLLLGVTAPSQCHVWACAKLQLTPRLVQAAPRFSNMTFLFEHEPQQRALTCGDVGLMSCTPLVAGLRRCSNAIEVRYRLRAMDDVLRAGGACPKRACPTIADGLS